MTLGIALFAGLVLLIGIVLIAVYQPEPSLADLPDEPDSATCVACGSGELERPMPGVYRCQSCGFEGGEDRGALEEKERQLAWSLEPWNKRRVAALADLDDARMLLLGAEGELKLLGSYLDEADPMRLNTEEAWKRIALTGLDFLMDGELVDWQRPGDLVEAAHRELYEETEKAWGALRRASEKVPEIDPGPELPHEPLTFDGGSRTGEAVTHAMQVFREVAERLERARNLLIKLDATNGG